MRSVASLNSHLIVRAVRLFWRLLVVARQLQASISSPASSTSSFTSSASSLAAYTSSLALASSSSSLSSSTHTTSSTTDRDTALPAASPNSTPAPKTDERFYHHVESKVVWIAI